MFLSIIIPEYQQKFSYLRRAMQSIDRQQNFDFNDVEVILVADGGDERLKTADFGIKNFKPVIVETKERKGCGGARNAGLDVAKGDWLYFFDSDDEFYGPLSLWYMKGCVVCNPQFECFNFHFINEGMGNRVLDNEMRSLYATLFKREIVEKYNIRFLEMNIYEDIGFLDSNVYLVGWDKYGYCFDIPIYYYHYNTSSITQQPANTMMYRFDCDVKQSYYVMNKMLEFGKNEPSFYIFNFFRLFNEYNAVDKSKIKKETLDGMHEFINKAREVYKKMSSKQFNAIKEKFGNKRISDGEIERIMAGGEY